MFGDSQLRTLWWEAYSTLWKEGVLVQADTGAVSLPAIEGVEMLYPAARGNRRLSLRILRTYALLQVLYGNHQLTQQHLRTPRGLLHGKTPLQVLQEFPQSPEDGRRFLRSVMALIYGTYL